MSAQVYQEQGANKETLHPKHERKQILSRHGTTGARRNTASRCTHAVPTNGKRITKSGGNNHDTAIPKCMFEAMGTQSKEGFEFGDETATPPRHIRTETLSRPYQKIKGRSVRVPHVSRGKEERQN